MKRMVSLSLAVCLLAASLPLPVYAEEPPAPTVDNQVTVEGTNDFGELLGDSLEEAQEEQAEEAVVGYGVTDLMAHWNFAPGATFNVGVFNLADKRYIDWSNVGSTLLPTSRVLDRYTSPGRTFSASLAVSW